MEEGKSDTNQAEALPIKKEWKLFEKSKLLYDLEDSGACHYVIIVCENGNIVFGGKDKQIYLFSSQLKPITTKKIDGVLSNGIAIKKEIYCAIIGKGIIVFD